MYDFKKIEKKWQKYWLENKTFETNINSDKEKYYCLDMFPYPSGSGLHVGHPKGYTATDIVSRYKRLKNFEVLHPMGWDAFGLPAEQFALKTGNNPNEFTQKNIDTFRKQIQSLGFSYDWNREINTTDPDYYKWSQWIFLKLYENGLAELKEIPVNFCEECGTVLANEEVKNGICDKGHKVIRKPMKQWILKITKYADRLLSDLDKLDWPESLKDMQRNWIGKTEGFKIDFKLLNTNDKITVFTTRPETIFGVSAIVLAPEYENVENFIVDEQKENFENFKKVLETKTDLERFELNNDKNGIFTGTYCINPVNNKKIPIFIGDYVLTNFGTGAVMCVPSADDRDFDFGKKYNLENIEIIENDKLINSDFLNDLSIDEAKTKIEQYLNEKNLGTKEITYKLRDWLFSRQRYWGEPFPILFDENDNIILENEKNLPIKLPYMEKIEPGVDGSSPLIHAKDWLEIDYNGKIYKRDTNTMPQWAGSCWYYIRYIDPKNDKELVNYEKAKKWLPVDLYIGGAEHAVLHLLYARFWFKFLYDINVVPYDEPFNKLFNQGMILGDDGQKMSKSKGNVVNPDDIVLSHGADVLRLYEMFMGPLDASVAWTEEGLDGAKRFIDRIWRLFQNINFVEKQNDVEILINKLILDVEKDIENLNFNVAISKLMTFINQMYKINEITKEQLEKFIIIIYPFIPHISEEMNELYIKKEKTVNNYTWPNVNLDLLVEKNVTIIIQINGKLKKKIDVEKDLSKEKLKELALEELNDLIDQENIIKEIIVPNKLVNFVVK